MAAVESVQTPGDASAGQAQELRREALTMALYVAVCLLAASIAVGGGDGHPEEVNVIAATWGITIGLALAHLFAFRISARLVGSGLVGSAEGKLAVAQLCGAAAVAVLVSIPVLLLPRAAELDTARFLLAGFISLAGYRVAIGGGSPRGRALVYAGTVLIIAIVIAVVKNILAGH
jgi:hypothetical protein